MSWDHPIARRLKLRDLQYLLTVVEAGSMAKAAALLAVSQPVVSKSIADLEHTVGHRLLDRSPRGVEPTVHGKTLVDASYAIFDELHQGVKDVEFLEDPAGGELSIGSNEVAMMGLLPAAIHALRLERPRVTANVVLANTPDEQRRVLRERRVEFAVGRLGGALDPEEFDTEVLLQERLFIVAGAHNPWTRRDKVELAELVGEPWIWPAPDSASGRAASRVFQAAGLPIPRAAVTSTTPQLSRPLLETGPFLSMMPASMLSLLDKPSSLRVVAIEQRIESDPLGLITLRKRSLSSLARRFVEHARTIAAEH